MTKIKFCKLCVEPNTRPNSIFNKEGICFSCQQMTKKSKTNYKKRAKELGAICMWAKKNTTSNFDCIIPVSGGKDSTRQALYMRDNLGMKPLLVSCTYPPEQQTQIGAENMANLIENGFDAICISPAPITWKKLTKYCFINFGNIFKSSELALYASAPKIALSYKIPLLVYGENPALQWGGDTHMSKDGNAIRQKYNNTLQGGNLDIYLNHGFKLNKLFWYDYPSDRELIKSKIKSIYLGYYIDNFDDDYNSKFSIQYGLKIREGYDADPMNTGSLTPYDALDDNFVFVNQMIKYFKFGFGKSTQQLSGFVRKGLYSRNEAIELVRKFDGNCSNKYIKSFCKYIGISEKKFWEIANKFRNKNIWKYSNGQWHMKVKLK